MAKIIRASLSKIFCQAMQRQKKICPSFLNCARIEKRKCKGINMENSFPLSYSSSSIIKNCSKLFWILDGEKLYLMKNNHILGIQILVIQKSTQKLACLEEWLSLYMPSSCVFLSISQIVIVLKLFIRI